MNTFHLNYIAVVIAGVAVFAFATIYQPLLARQRPRLSALAASRPDPAARLMALELCNAVLVLAAVVALAAPIGVRDVAESVVLALGVWIAFPVVLLVGSVTQKGVPCRRSFSVLLGHPRHRFGRGNDLRPHPRRPDLGLRAMSFPVHGGQRLRPDQPSLRRTS